MFPVFFGLEFRALDRLLALSLLVAAGVLFAIVDRMEHRG
jgi:hypothetical protein